MQATNAPLKWLIPWAQQSTNIFELPATTTDPTRASQSLGFPPETMLPPDSGGVPPQGIDFNAGLYQVARITWWLMYGGPFVFDATFATNSAISGYAQGAQVASSDYLGQWLNTTDNNQINPDTTGTGWVPASSYGSTATALTNANVTFTPLQAMKKILVFTGTLTGNVVVTLPAWVYEWTVVNQCSGAFTLTLTTSGGLGAIAPQGATSRMRGDGTNINLDRAPGTLIGTQVFVAGGIYTPTLGTNSIIVEGAGGGGGGGGCPATTATQQATAGGGVGGNWARARFTSGFAGAAVAIGAGGSAGATGSNAGGAGGTTSFGSGGTMLTIQGGIGGAGGTASAATVSIFASVTNPSAPTVAGGVLLGSARGSSGTGNIVLSLTSILSGTGGDSPFGVGGRPVQGAPGSPGIGNGAGGGGCSQTPSQAGSAGGAGTIGILYIYEYA